MNDAGCDLIFWLPKIVQKFEDLTTWQVGLTATPPTCSRTAQGCGGD
jgi:hypothetical protein